MSKTKVIETKEVTCASTSCPRRRIHHESPLEERGLQKFWVKADEPGPYFCSIECYMYWKVESKEILDETNEPILDGTGNEDL